MGTFLRNRFQPQDKLKFFLLFYLTFTHKRVKLYTRKKVSLGNNFCIGFSFELTFQHLSREYKTCFLFFCKLGKQSGTSGPELLREMQKNVRKDLKSTPLAQLPGTVFDVELAAGIVELIYKSVETFKAALNLLAGHEFIRRTLDRKSVV